MALEPARHAGTVRAGPIPVKRVDGQRIVSYGTSATGYDVRCSREFKGVHQHPTPPSVVDPRALRPPKSFVDVVADSCIIPPNSFALALPSRSHFRIPRTPWWSASAKHLRASAGIIVNVTPLEPGPVGRARHAEFQQHHPLPARRPTHRTLVDQRGRSADAVLPPGRSRRRLRDQLQGSRRQSTRARPASPCRRPDGCACLACGGAERTGAQPAWIDTVRISPQPALWAKSHDATACTLGKNLTDSTRAWRGGRQPAVRAAARPRAHIIQAFGEDHDVEDHSEWSVPHAGRRGGGHRRRRTSADRGTRIGRHATSSKTAL